MLAFRVSSHQGIGHIMRMKWLALALKQKGEESLFVLDAGTESLAYLLDDVTDNIIFSGAMVGDEIADALFVLEVLKEFSSVNQVVVDHYKLGKAWELKLSNQGFYLVAFDDIAREHACNMLFDQKWAGEATYSRYQNKLPQHCLAFLGPKYSVLSPEYQLASNKSDHESNILVSLGGGGDLNLIANYLASLTKLSELKKTHIKVVIGPQAINAEVLEQRCSLLNNVTLLYQPNSLAEHYRSADLFVGALGTSLYELAVVNVPALTFSIAENQYNEIENLEALGHYFHLNDFDVENVDELANLTCCIMQHLSRVNTLRQHKTCVIDGFGADRVSQLIVEAKNALVNQEHKDVAQLRLAVSDNQNLMMQQPLSSGENMSSSQPDYFHQLNDIYTVSSIDDSDINRYLIARNLPNNQDKMTISEDIQPINHYQWWFKNQRKSYVLRDGNKAVLYIWHQEHQIAGTTYLFGGWFTASDDIPYNVAMVALNWQLSYLKSLYPKGHWLAVIHKENRFVNLLNQYLGFKATDASSKAYRVTQTLFPKAHSDVFNFVERVPVSN